jgi:hypothetical protein
MLRAKPGAEKIPWRGRLISVQPRIRLMRSFDEIYHGYHGYVLGIESTCGEMAGMFQIAIGKGAHEKHRFRVDMEVSGLSVPVANPLLETAAYYKTSKLNVEEDAGSECPAGPPFLGIPPDLPTYRARGHRRLDPRTYSAKCSTCIWGCEMPVEITIDHWNPSEKTYRFETFCYGPKSCKFYKAGRIRTVPGRRGMIYEEDDWVDEQMTEHRGPDD